MRTQIAATAFIAAIAIPSLRCAEPLVPLTVVRGTLLGHDGRPMPMAHVHLARPQYYGRGEPLVSVEVREDGTYELRTERVGGFMLQFTGVDHVGAEVPLVADPPLEVSVDVRLPTHAYREDLSGVRVIGDYNDWDLESALRVEPQPDGTYSVTIETDADSVVYMLDGIVTSRGWPVNDPRSDRFRLAEYGYHSIALASGGAVTITVDPARLVSSEAPVFTWTRWWDRMAEAVIDPDDPRSTSARLYDVLGENWRRFKAFVASEASAPAESVEYDPARGLAELTERLALEEDSLVRQALSVALLQLADTGAAVDSELCRRALNEVPPASPLWSYYHDLWLGRLVAKALGGWYTVSSSASAYAPGDGSPYDRYMTYLAEGVAQHGDSVVRSMMLYGMIKMASQAGREADVAEYYRQLQNDYAGSFALRRAKRWAPDRRIRVGNPVPAFAYSSMDQPDLTYTPESLQGTVYLIDFWATWCTPCVAEMETFHRAYKEFGPRGFEIVSVSFDLSTDDVLAFRESRWKMPWFNAYVGPDDEVEHARFEIVGIPRTILVDGDGTIVGVDGDVWGEKLRETLVRLFDSP
jgi:thiol-disulfide isomerase/thioredoxin